MSATWQSLFESDNLEGVVGNGSKLEANKVEFRQLYMNDVSYAEIMQRFDISVTTVRSWRKKLGLPVRQPEVEDPTFGVGLRLRGETVEAVERLAEQKGVPRTVFLRMIVEWVIANETNIF